MSGAGNDAREVMADARDQEKFYTAYRGRQSALHHLAYLRTAKVKAGLLMLARNGISLGNIAVFDYGFGPGTLFRHCDENCRIAGLEIDEDNVAAVREMLASRGHDVSSIATVELDAWKTHPLLDKDRRYELMILSHVLEHLDDPVGLLRRFKGNLAADGGRVLGLLPVNERKADVDHKWTCDRALVDEWARASGYEVVDYQELDHWSYWLQPVALMRNRFCRLVALAGSLFLGLAQARCPPRVWFGLGKLVGAVTAAKPAQSVFLLAPVRET